MCLKLLILYVKSVFLSICYAVVTGIPLRPVEYRVRLHFKYSWAWAHFHVRMEGVVASHARGNFKPSASLCCFHTTTIGFAFHPRRALVERCTAHVLFMNWRTLQLVEYTALPSALMFYSWIDALGVVDVWYSEGGLWGIKVVILDKISQSVW